ncbi:hypothetical protein [Bradyrhizobium iriomotense]|uniref:Uncharacterized protein n=1 Tax=Bradyrhizobium iriomotense TaxID=441950 RepID=A0ABQ6B0W2_9BRAD|nr:hypothetical protein [Bradyrhizobium iriomotense]GLR87345.1 hypothetical protein GCM10007857_40560 [Bradyrhizobium iriomotense]
MRFPLYPGVSLAAGSRMARRRGDVPEDSASPLDLLFEEEARNLSQVVSPPIFPQVV